MSETWSNRHSHPAMRSSELLFHFHGPISLFVTFTVVWFILTLSCAHYRSNCMDIGNSLWRHTTLCRSAYLHKTLFGIQLERVILPGSSGQSTWNAHWRRCDRHERHADGNGFHKVIGKFDGFHYPATSALGFPVGRRNNSSTRVCRPRVLQRNIDASCLPRSACHHNRKIFGWCGHKSHSSEVRWGGLVLAFMGFQWNYCRSTQRASFFACVLVPSASNIVTKADLWRKVQKTVREQQNNLVSHCRTTFCLFSGRSCFHIWFLGSQRKICDILRKPFPGLAIPIFFPMFSNSEGAIPRQWIRAFFPELLYWANEPESFMSVSYRFWLWS